MIKYRLTQAEKRSCPSEGADSFVIYGKKTGVPGRFDKSAASGTTSLFYGGGTGKIETSECMTQLSRHRCSKTDDENGEPQNEGQFDQGSRCQLRRDNWRFALQHFPKFKREVKRHWISRQDFQPSRPKKEKPQFQLIDTAAIRNGTRG